MADLKIKSQKPISMTELQKKLKKMKTESQRVEKTLNLLNSLKPIDEKTAKEITKEIENLQIPRLKERHIVKILDLMPKDLESIKAIFAGENITISNEDMEKIYQVLKKAK